MIRVATPADASALCEIYAQAIHTPATFEYVLPTAAEFAQRIRVISSEYPYLLYEQQGRIVGYAYAHRYGERAAFRYAAELSIYIHAAARGQGIGKRLYGALLQLLQQQGVHSVFALITQPNAASNALHAHFGLQPCGTLPEIGYKNTQWQHLGILGRTLPSNDPPRFLPFPTLPMARIAHVLQQCDCDTPPIP